MFKIFSLCWGCWGCAKQFIVLAECALKFFGCILSAHMLPLDVSVSLCYLWTCLFLYQTVLPWCVCSTAACRGPRRVCFSEAWLCCPERCLSNSSLCCTFLLHTECAQKILLHLAQCALKIIIWMLSKSWQKKFLRMLSTRLKTNILQLFL
jgi:hypothetical protein